MDCGHDWRDEPVDIVLTIDACHGPTDALVKCPRCGQYYLLRLLHWQGPRLALRIFALATLPADSVTVFLRNMRSDYCDLSRHQAEVDALMAIAEPVSRISVIDMDQMRVVTDLPRAEAGKLDIKSWRRQAPREDDPRWRALLSQNLLERQG